MNTTYCTLCTIMMCLIMVTSCQSVDKKNVTVQTAQPVTQTRQPLPPLRDNFREFSLLAFQIFVRQNNEVATFYKKLSGEIAGAEKEILQFILNDYPVIVPGDIGKMCFHHKFLILDNTKSGQLEQKTFRKSDTSILYRLSVKDLAFFKTEDYDNIRFVWWNPYVENFNDPRFFSLLQNEYISTGPLDEVEHVLAINYFKTTFSRNPNDIKSLFERFKTPIYDSINIDLYNSLGLKETVNTLLEAYNFYKSNNHDGFLTMMNDRRYSIKKDGIREFVGAMDIKWYYSFWERRSREKNSDAVLEVLNEIQQHYTAKM